jgi:hypothetical protein
VIRHAALVEGASLKSLNRHPFMLISRLFVRFANLLWTIRFSGFSGCDDGHA